MAVAARATGPWLAAALVAGISVDEKLGLKRDQTETGQEIEELRAEMAQLRDVVAGLQRQVMGQVDPASEAEQRRAQRREWARQSRAASPPVQSPAPGRSAGRGRSM